MHSPPKNVEKNLQAHALDFYRDDFPFTQQGIWRTEEKGDMSGIISV